MKYSFTVRDINLRLLGTVKAGSLISAIRMAQAKFGAKVYDVSHA